MDPHVRYFYRHTFITVEEPNEIAVRRSKSLPAKKGRAEATDAQVKESEMANYVTGLAEKTALFFEQGRNMQQGAEMQNALTKADASASNAEPLASTAPELASRGSSRHPELCNRPCIFFKLGNCENGTSCSFCHMEHTTRLPKLDKKQREFIKSFNKTEVLSIMLRYLRLAAAKQGFERQATEILGLVECEIPAESSDPEALLGNIPEKMFKRLHWTLTRMSFVGILGLASKEQIGSQLREYLFDALGRLRFAVPESRVQPKE